MSGRPPVPVLGFLNQAVSVLNKPILWSAVGFGFCVYVAIITWGIRDRSHLSPHMPSVQGGRAVATITRVEEKSPQSVASGRVFLPGEMLAIDAGTVELKLKRGATLVIDGPASLSVDDDNRATLREGKLVANVPLEAIGFTLETPTAKIVDFGTEFGVLIEAGGSSEVQVFEGQIDVQSAGAESHLPALRVARGEKVIVSANRDAPLVSQPATSADSRRFDWANSTRAALALRRNSARRKVISIDWDPNEDSLGPTDVAGVVPVDHWNVFTTSTAQFRVKDDAGITTTAEFTTHTLAGPVGAGIGPLPGPDLNSGPDGRMMNVVVCDNAALSTFQTYLSFSDVPYSTYDVYVYTSANVSGRTAEFRIGTDVKSKGSANPGTYTQGENYLLFSGLTGSSFKIEARSTSEVPQIVFNGLQIVERVGELSKPSQ